MKLRRVIIQGRENVNTKVVNFREGKKFIKKGEKKGEERIKFGKVK